MLEDGVGGAAERPPQGKFAVQRPRRVRPLDLPAHQRQRDGGDAFGFEGVRERTDRTRAQRSDGNE